MRQLLADAGRHGAGKRYLIQHSAGSGKSYSITWLAHQLIRLEKDGAPVVDSIIVVTDRVILDRQIHDTIRKYLQVRSTVGHAERSRDLRRFIESGKKIIISTVQKFPFILDEIGNEHRGRRFAIIIDEAEINPVPTSGGGQRPEPELDRLSKILKEFNDLFIDIDWDDGDRVRELISDTIPSRVAEDTAFKNAQKNSDKENARIEHDKALLRVMTAIMKDDTQLFKQFQDNEGFKRWMTDTVYELAAEQVGGP